MGAKVTGVVFSDLGQGASFMALPWVQETLRRRLGFSPYPATLNVRLESAEAIAIWREVKRTAAAVEVPPPNDSFCRARCFPIAIGGRTRAAVLLPEVEGYPPDKLEIVAPVRLKDELSIGDGDRITIDFKSMLSQR